jgi:ATP-dependent Clp protease ATP-binding subunit ClpC
MQALGQLDPDATRVVVLAQEEAVRLGHGYIGTEHVLVAMLAHQSEAKRILWELGLEADAVRRHIDEVVARSPALGRPDPVATQSIKRTLELAFTAASREGSQLATTEHLLLGLIEQGEGVGAHVLGDLGVTAGRVRELRR